MKNKIIIILIILLVIICIYYLIYYFYDKSYYFDYSKINKVNKLEIFEPLSIFHLQSFLFSNKKQFCIIGAGYSHGGHTLLENGIQINMKNINNITINKDLSINVEGGCIWYDIINFLLKYNRTIAVSQSYFNFSIGGSISVNCHGRDINYGTISNTIKSMKIMLSNGKIILCDKYNNTELFDGIIGGYGLLGIIIECTIISTENEKLKCIIVEDSKLLSYNNDNIVLYNAVIYPTLLNKTYNYYWIKTDEELTTKDLIKPKKELYWKTMIIEQLIRISSIFKKIRAKIEPFIDNNKIHYKSYEIGYDANELQPLTNHPSITILQEYFIPIDNIYLFLEKLKKKLYLINIINISIRYVKKIIEKKIFLSSKELAALSRIEDPELNKVLKDFLIRCHKEK